jgi:hypothetical protein
LDHRVTTVDKDCWYCAPAVLPQGGYKHRDAHDENGILRVKLYRYELDLCEPVQEPTCPCPRARLLPNAPRGCAIG